MGQPNAAQTQTTAKVKDVSNTLQTHGRKPAVWEGAIQTQAEIQI